MCGTLFSLNSGFSLLGYRGKVFDEAASHVIVYSCLTSLFARNFWMRHDYWEKKVVKYNTTHFMMIRKTFFKKNTKANNIGKVIKINTSKS